MKHLLPSSLGIIGTFLTVLFGWLLISSAAYEESTYLDVKQGSVELSNSGDEISQIIDYYITVEPKITGRITVDIFKNDKFLRTDTLSDRNVVKLASGGEYYYYKLTISGKKDHDIYQIEFKYDDQTVKKIIPITSTSMGIVNIESPLKQFKSGTPIGEIQCEEGLELTLKASDGSPICVKPETKQKLIERGWAKSLGSVVSQKSSENILIPDNAVLQVKADAPCAWMTLQELPHSELLKQHDRTGRNALMLKIDDEDITKVPHLKEMLAAMHSESGFEPYEYDENTWEKSITSTESEQQQIWDWLKETSDSQFGQTTDSSFTTYFTYRDNYYHIIWALC